jgi:hypothetical protein
MLISIYGTRIKGINVARVLFPDIESLIFPFFFIYEMPKLKEIKGEGRIIGGYHPLNGRCHCY